MKRVRQGLAERLSARAFNGIVTLAEVTEATEETGFLTTEVTEGAEVYFKIREGAERTDHAEMTTIARSTDCAICTE